MRLLIVLSVIACGYTDKLDRAYLPPLNAATAGGSPGALLAPGVTSVRQPSSNVGQAGQAEFGQGFPSGPQPGGTIPGQSRPSTFGGVSGSTPNAPGFGTGNNQALSGINQFSSGSGSNAAAPGGGNIPLLGANAPFEFSDLQGQTYGQQNYRPQSGRPSSQGLGLGTQGANAPQVQAYQPERAQAAADRNAEILKYINDNNGNSYVYSYETSNGISAEESGEAVNGVKAQGGFSYTGDDGQAYSLTYTADENGFQPQGEHLPTPHPIPEEILKSIEDNARAAAAGTQEGAYNPEEYDSEDALQQYNKGPNSFNQPQGPSQGSFQGSLPQRPAIQGNRFSVNQGSVGPNRISGQSVQIGQTGPNQGSNPFATNPNLLNGKTSQNQQSIGNSRVPFGQLSSQTGLIDQAKPSQGLQGQSGQYQTGLGSTLDSFGQGPTNQGLSQYQGQGPNGYSYYQPQNGFGSATQFGSRPSVQNRPLQQNQISTSGSPNSESASGLQSGKLSPSETPFGPSQSTQFGLNQSQNLNRPGNQLMSSASVFGQGLNQLNANKPFGSSQEPQAQPGSQGSFGTTGPSGYKYQTNANRPLFGNRPTGVPTPPSRGTQYQVNGNQPSNGINRIEGPTQFGANTIGSIKGQQYPQNANQLFGGSTGLKPETSPFGVSETQKTGPGNVFGQVNKFGSNTGVSQSSSQFRPGSQQPTSAQGPSGSRFSSPIQAPYQYNKPSQSFPTQGSGQNSLGPSGSNRRPSSGAQGDNVQIPSISAGPGTTSTTQGANGQRPGFAGTTGTSPNSQGTNARPGANYSGYQGSRPGFTQQLEGQRPGGNALEVQDINKRPGVSSSRYPVAKAPRPDYTATQGVNGQRPDFTPFGSQGINRRPSSGFSGPQGSNGDRPTVGSQGANGQRPDISSSGSEGPSNGVQGRPEQFGGPRQPPSFNPQEGYKY